MVRFAGFVPEHTIAPDAGTLSYRFRSMPGSAVWPNVVRFAGFSPEHTIAQYAQISVVSSLSEDKTELCVWRPDTEIDVGTASRELINLLAGALLLPQGCVHLYWEETTEGYVVGMTKVSLFGDDVNPRHVEESNGHSVCSVCYDPLLMCDQGRVVPENDPCASCLRESLCASCAVRTVRGRLCLMCLTEAEGPIMTPSQRERWLLCVGSYDNRKK